MEIYPTHRKAETIFPKSVTAVCLFAVPKRKSGSKESIRFPLKKTQTTNRNQCDLNGPKDIINFGIWGYIVVVHLDLTSFVISIFFHKI